MAHIEKYKAHSVGHMLAHYRRDPSSLERDNIDPALTHLNSTLNFWRTRTRTQVGNDRVSHRRG